MQTPENNALRPDDLAPTDRRWTIILYHIQSKRRLEDVDRAVENALRHVVFDPLDPCTPASYLSQIEFALRSDQPWSKLLPGFAHSEALTREFMQRLVQQIRTEIAKPELTIDEHATLPLEMQPYIDELLLPLDQTSPSAPQTDEIAQEIKRKYAASEKYLAHLKAIRFAVRSNVNLSRLANNVWSEQDVRRYLVDVGRAIKHN